MFYPVLRKSSPSRSLVRSLTRPLAGLFALLGLVATSSPTLAAVAAEELSGQPPLAISASTGTPATHQSLPDGVYLYGQSSEPDQIGAAYMVFEVSNSNVVGAFYMPYSSFDCFQGEFQSNQLALNVIDSYDRTVHPYALALQPDSSVASTVGESVVPVGLEGYHRVATVSDNDRRLLTTCQADFAQ